MLSFSVRGPKNGDIIVSWFSLKIGNPSPNQGISSIEVATQGRVLRGKIKFEIARMLLDLDQNDNLTSVVINLKPEISTNILLE